MASHDAFAEDAFAEDAFAEDAFAEQYHRYIFCWWNSFMVISRL